MKKVEVYWNLHKKLWSVRERPSGKVIAHTSSLVLKDAKYVVQPAGRERVRKEKKKNVHAYISGHLFAIQEMVGKRMVSEDVTYNPYKHESFVLVCDTDIEVEGSSYVELYMNEEKGRVKAWWVVEGEPSTQEPGEVQSSGDTHGSQEGTEEERTD